ncbi:29054_t:CDS:2, partial [Gigaspora margarita]
RRFKLKTIQELIKLSFKKVDAFTGADALNYKNVAIVIIVAPSMSAFIPCAIEVAETAGELILLLAIDKLRFYILATVNSRIVIDTMKAILIMSVGSFLSLTHTLDPVNQVGELRSMSYDTDFEKNVDNHIGKTHKPGDPILISSSDNSDTKTNSILSYNEWRAQQEKRWAYCG